MYALQDFTTGLFIGENGEWSTRLNACKFTDRKQAYNAREVYYLIAKEKAKKINVVPYPKEDNLAMLNEFQQLKYTLAVENGYSHAVSSSDLKL